MIILISLFSIYRDQMSTVHFSNDIKSLSTNSKNDFLFEKNELSFIMSSFEKSEVLKFDEDCFR
jgi:hypothetical protein